MKIPGRSRARRLAELFTIVVMLAGARLTTYASAQSVTLSGLVMDGSAGAPLEGATVSLQDAGLVVTTDAEGVLNAKCLPLWRVFWPE